MHHADTPLHLAFSCYLFDADGRLLVTRRALHKPTWPGRRGPTAVRPPGARARTSRTPCAGGCARSSALALERPAAACCPAFRYRAVMADGVVENEMCPVFVATHRRTP